MMEHHGARRGSSQIQPVVVEAEVLNVGERKSGKFKQGDGAAEN